MTEEDSSRLLMFLMELRKQGIVDTSLLKALETIPFYHFSQDDHAMRDATISAKLLQALNLTKRSVVLEVQRNTGYHTALLATLSRRVISTADKAFDAQMVAMLERLHCPNVTSAVSAPEEGWEDAAPYDAILVNQLMPKIPAELLTQLHSNGRMILPLGGTPAHAQWMLVTKDGFKFESKKLEHIPMPSRPIYAA